RPDPQRHHRVVGLAPGGGRAVPAGPVRRRAGRGRAPDDRPSLQMSRGTPGLDPCRRGHHLPRSLICPGGNLAMKLRHNNDNTGTPPEEDRSRLDAAATTRTGEDRDNDLSAPGPDEGPDSPTQLKGKGIFAAVKRTFKQFSEDNISDWAAALTYY